MKWKPTAQFKKNNHDEWRCIGSEGIWCHLKFESCAEVCTQKVEIERTDTSHECSGQCDCICSESEIAATEVHFSFLLKMLALMFNQMYSQFDRFLAYTVRNATYPREWEIAWWSSRSKSNFHREAATIQSILIWFCNYLTATTITTKMKKHLKKNDEAHTINLIENLN